MFNLQEKYAINNSKKPFHPVFEIRSLLLRKLFLRLPCNKYTTYKTLPT